MNAVVVIFVNVKCAKILRNMYYHYTTNELYQILEAHLKSNSYSTSEYRCQFFHFRDQVNYGVEKGLITLLTNSPDFHMLPVCQVYQMNPKPVANHK